MYSTTCKITNNTIMNGYWNSFITKKGKGVTRKKVLYCTR